MAAEGVEHLASKLGEHGGVVFAVDHEGVAAGAHAALDVGHGADGGPVVAKLVYGDVVAKAFPDVIGGHALADYVGVVGGDVEEAAGAEAFIVNEGDVADRGADAGAKDAEALNPAAEAVLAVPFGVPVGEEEDGGASAVAFPTRAS